MEGYEERKVGAEDGGGREKWRRNEMEEEREGKKMKEQGKEKGQGVGEAEGKEKEGCGGW